MTNLENLLKERKELIKENYYSNEEYIYFLKKEGFNFLFFRELENNKNDKEFHFFKYSNKKIHFVSFIDYKFPIYNSFNFEDIATIKIYNDCFKVVLRDKFTFYIGTENHSITSLEEARIASQIIIKVLSSVRKNNKIVVNL